jgi:GT2 family glycosyltransferase
MLTSINGGGQSGPRYVEGFRWVGGWCTYIPYETIKQCGIYDENFIIGDGVDIDYSYKVKKAGKSILVTDYWVDHHRLTSHKNEQKPHEELEDIKKKNGAYFRKKHKLGEFK